MSACFTRDSPRPPTTTPALVLVVIVLAVVLLLLRLVVVVVVVVAPAHDHSGPSLGKPRGGCREAGLAGYDIL